MQILYLESVDSTQKYLKELLQNKKIQAPYAVVTEIQSDGVGSRENSWIGMKGNLFLSFAYKLDELPNDLKLESSSIYFSYILKEILFELGSSVWIKWPNDFYLGDKKIGGMITNIVRDSLVCGVGINLLSSTNKFSYLDIKISKEELIKKYFIKLEKSVSWKQVFSKYELEFHKNKNFFTHNENLKISLGNASLQSDGSIINNGERIYSLR